MVELKKIETHLQQLPQKNKPPTPYQSGSLQNFNNCLVPT